MYAINYKNIFSCAPEIKNNPKTFFFDQPITKSWGPDTEVELFCETICLSCNKFLLIESSFTVQSEDGGETTFSLHINQKKVADTTTSGDLSTTGIIWGNKICLNRNHDNKINIRITAMSTAPSNVDYESFPDFGEVKGAFLSVTTL